MTLIQNAVRIIDQDVYLVSTSVDDPTSYTFDDGLTLSIAGGTEFARRDGDFIKLSTLDRYTEWNLTDDDPFYWVAERLLTPVDDTPTWRPIRELSLIDLQQLADGSSSIQSRVALHWLKIRSTTAV